jgi:hypothetical protein
LFEEVTTYKEIDPNTREYYFTKDTALIGVNIPFTWKVIDSQNSTTIFSENYTILQDPGGPADIIVYTPSSIQVSTEFDTIIEIINQNPYIGQDFTIDYWITNDTLNYSSGQQTIYIPPLNKTNITATLTTPDSAGTYKFKGLVYWHNGTATAYDSFSVFIPVTTTTTGGGGGAAATVPATSEEIFESEERIQGKIEITEFPNTISLNQGEIVERQIKVTNIGEESIHNVKLIISGLLLDLYTTNPEVYNEVKKDETKTFTIIFDGNLTPKDYNIKFIAISDENIEEADSILTIKEIPEIKTEIGLPLFG